MHINYTGFYDSKYDHKFKTEIQYNNAILTTIIYVYVLYRATHVHLIHLFLNINSYSLSKHYIYAIQSKFTNYQRFEKGKS